METEPSEHAEISHADPAKVNLVPRAHVSFGHCLGPDQKIRGLWERDSAKVTELKNDCACH